MTSPPPRTLHVDYNDGKGLPAGWRGWWVRGVDLFGRVSGASNWGVGRVDDVAPPPAPVLLQGEWVQRSLPAMTVAVLGRSVEASRWLTATADDDPTPEAGLVAAWTLPPEQADLRDDIDGFRLFLRNAAPKAGAAAGAPLAYPDWPVPIAQFGPLQIVSRGAVELFTPDPSLTVDLTDGELVPEVPRVPAVAHNARTAYRTNLALDGGIDCTAICAFATGGCTFAIGPKPVLLIAANHTGYHVSALTGCGATGCTPPGGSGGGGSAHRSSEPFFSGHGVARRYRLLVDQQTTARGQLRRLADPAHPISVRAPARRRPARSVAPALFAGGGASGACSTTTIGFGPVRDDVQLPPAAEGQRPPTNTPLVGCRRSTSCGLPARRSPSRQ